MSATLREAVSNARALLERAKAWPTCKHVRRDPHTYGCLDCGGAPSEDEWKSTVEALVEATSATPPAVTHADLAAVVEEVATHDDGQTLGHDDEDVAYWQGQQWAAREVLRRVTGGEVPRVLLESRVVEVLTDVLGQREGIQRTHFMQVDMDEAEPLGNGWERAIREAGRMLGLTLPAGPGGGEPNPPESPDGSTDPEMERILRMSDSEVDAELTQAGVDVAAFEERVRAHVAKVRASLPPDSPYFKAASSLDPAQQPAPREGHPTSAHAKSVVTKLEMMLTVLDDGTLGRRDVVNRVKVLLDKAAKWDAAVGRAKDTNGIFSAWCVGGFAPKEERVASVLRYLGLTLPTPPSGPGDGETYATSVRHAEECDANEDDASGDALPCSMGCVPDYALEHRNPRVTSEGPALTLCRAGSDGECRAKDCPQTHDGEPSATGRACPLPEGDEENCGPVAQPEPAAPEVVVDTGACRVLADGAVEAWDGKREQWGPPETGWPINPVPLLARALAEARRERDEYADVAGRALASAVVEAAQLAAQDMRERAEEAVLSGPVDETPTRGELAGRIRALSLTGAPAASALPSFRVRPLGLREEASGRHALHLKVNGVEVDLVGDYDDKASRHLLCYLFACAELRFQVVRESSLVRYMGRPAVTAPRTEEGPSRG